MRKLAAGLAQIAADQAVALAARQGEWTQALFFAFMARWIDDHMVREGSKL